MENEQFTFELSVGHQRNKRENKEAKFRVVLKQ
jgi:hypothetical protein